MYFNYKPMENNDVPGVSSLYELEGPVFRIYEEEFYTLLHTQK